MEGEREENPPPNEIEKRLKKQPRNPHFWGDVVQSDPDVIPSDPTRSGSWTALIKQFQEGKIPGLGHTFVPSGARWRIKPPLSRSSNVMHRNSNEMRFPEKVCAGPVMK